MKRKSIIIITILLFATIFTGYHIQSGSTTELGDNKENNAKILDKTINATGQFVQNNHPLFLSALDRTVKKKDENVAFLVDGISVSSEELQFRFGLCVSSGIGPQTIDGVKEVLIREKLIQKEAARLGVLPTDTEIKEFINKEKETLKNDPEYKAGVEKIIKTWGLTEYEYWNIYEWDNVYRLLTANNLSKYLFKEYYDKDLITFEEDENLKEEWNKFMDNKVIKAEITEVQKITD